MKIRIAVLPLAFSCLLTGCSVIMAAHDEKDIDLKTLRTGMHRSEVEQILTNKLHEGGAHYGRAVTYQYFTGDERSLGRAAAYGLLDIATLGLAEIVTTPVEALQGDKHLVTVTYDAEGRVVRVRDTIERAPLDKPERMLGLEGA